jgi:O-antigen/teichoic acid export membrane protein
LTALFGEGFGAGDTALVVLLVAQLINVGTGPVGYLLIMTGNQVPYMLLSVLSLALNVSAGVILIPRLGAAGAALAAGAGVVVLFLSSLAVVRLRLGLWPWDRRLVKALWAGLAAVAVVVVALWQAAGAGAVVRTGLGALAVPVFWLVLWSSGLDPEDRGVLAVLRPSRRRGGV